MNVKVVIGRLVLLVMGLVACASHEIKALAPHPIDAYPVRGTAMEVTIAVEPLATKEKAEAAFSVDLTEQGYAPLLLAMESRSGDNVLLVKDAIELVDSRGNLHKPTSANAMVEKFEHNKTKIVPLILLGFLGLPSYMSADEADKKMRSDWTSKELPSQEVLLPNRKAHGVVYFELGPGLTTLPNATLRIPLQNLKTGENQSVTLRIGITPPKK